MDQSTKWFIDGASLFGATFGLLTTWFERCNNYGSSMEVLLDSLYLGFINY